MQRPTDKPAASRPTPEQYARRVMSGDDRSARATLLRAALSAAEPAYASAAAVRNWLFDSGVRRTHRLPRPAVSVGNITTGGTGKTPAVRWLARRLREEGRRVAVLARGYGSAAGAAGDEQVMLEQSLNPPGEANPVVVVANPDRRAGAAEAMRRRPGTDVFLLDDGFQHRRVARDFDLVLVSAASPFGYGHVLPRGMLREPLRGLGRAGAFLVTHADQADKAALSSIVATLRRHNAASPVYYATHAHAALLTPAAPASGPPDRPVDDLRRVAWFAFCGIGDPQTFLRQLEAAGGRCAGHRWFGDHHRYTEQDLASVRRDAAAGGADVLVTTEKDWAKIAALSASRATDTPGVLPIWRVELELHFRGDDERRLLDDVRAALGRRTA